MALQYERQKQYLKWPVGVADPEAIAKLDKMRPIELSVPNPMKDTEDPLAATHRAQYRDYISKVFPDIAGIIGASWTATNADPTAVANLNPLVKWEGSAQKKLLEQIAPWSERTPSTLEILYTQEDLWILAGLMNIIKEVNGDARENFQAAIKEVKWVRIGQSANGDAGEIETVAAPLAADGGSGYGGGGSSPYGGGGGSSPYGGNPYGGGGGGGGAAAVAGGGAVVASDPADNRYVDSNYKPVRSTDLISKMKSSNPEDAFFAVAKRVPVQLRLTMDQRKIADLVAACGNNDLMVEVKQVRIGTEESKEVTVTQAAAGGKGGGYGGGGGGYGGGYGDSGGVGAGYGGGGGGYGAGYGDAGGGYGGTAGANITWNEKTYELDVEIYGIVLLFNPVDINKLGIEKVQESTELETTVADGNATEPAQPAPTPAPAQPTTPDASGTPPTGAAPTAPNAAPVSPAPANPTPENPTPATPAPAATESAAIPVPTPRSLE